MDKIYLPGLNGIRAIAASIVVIFHIDQFSHFFGVTPLGFGNSGMASYAVDMFFALSGYLITFLLLIEKEKFGRIELSKFYIRRILRIWPLYYIGLIITGFLILFGIVDSNEKLLQTFSLYTLFLPNVAYAYSFDIITIFPLWSVGVEEQFYALWPLLVNKNKKVMQSIIIVIVVYIIIRLGLRFYDNPNLSLFVALSSVDALGYGGVAAYLVYKKHYLTRILFHPIVQIACWLFLIVSVFYKPVSLVSFFTSSMHAFVYAILIANVSANAKTLVSLESYFMNFLGRISYGLYVYNMIVICALGYFIKDFLSTIESIVIKNMLMYFGVVGLTIAISYFSYYYLESKFLSLKIKYSKIHSTNKLDIGK